MSTAPAQPIPLPADWRDFWSLTKPRVMSLVIFTGLCGLLAAPVPVNPVIGFVAILCIAVGAGGSAALNMWWEADLVAKLIEDRCLDCHAADDPDGKLVMEKYADILKGGESGAVVVRVDFEKKPLPLVKPVTTGYGMNLIAPPSEARITGPVPGTPSINEPVQRMSVPPVAVGVKTTSL